jgi:DNA-directed RNA polymerase II subunit RPB4
MLSDRSLVGNGAQYNIISVSNLALATLCCESADEAKTLIPSLANKIDDNDLQDLLDEILKMRRLGD